MSLVLRSNVTQSDSFVHSIQTASPKGRNDHAMSPDEMVVYKRREAKICIAVLYIPTGHELLKAEQKKSNLFISDEL
jgi:hypothetical protein